MSCQGLVSILPESYVLDKRKQFFEAIIAAVRLLPDEVDLNLEHEKVTPLLSHDQFKSNPRNGTLMFRAPFEFHPQTVAIEGEEAEPIYEAIDFSIYQFGKILRVGVLMPARMSRAFLLDPTAEYQSLWLGEVGVSTPVVVERPSDRVLLDWFFECPHLHDGDWREVERFTLGIRHVYNRIFAILHRVVANDPGHFRSLPTP